MKTLTKLFLILFIVGASKFSFGQTTTTVLFWPNSMAPADVVGTALSGQHCNSGLQLRVPNPNNGNIPYPGFLFGNIDWADGQAPDYGTKEVAQLYKLESNWQVPILPTQNPKIDSVTFATTTLSVSANPGDLFCRVYNVNSGKPGALIGTSNALNMSDVVKSVSTVGYNSFTFTPPIAVTGDFIVSVVLSQIDGDTISINAAGTIPGLSNCGVEIENASMVYTNLGAFEWKTITELTGVAKVDFLILPNVIYDELPGTGIGISSHDASLKLSDAFPSPAKNRINLNFAIENTGNVSVLVYNVNGALVKTENYGQVAKGAYQKSINISDLSSGFYMYEVKSGSSKAYGKFVAE